MTINPVELSQTEKQHLSELAEKTRDDSVRAAVDAYLERVDETAEPTGISPTRQARPIWEEIDDIIKDVPTEAFKKLPRDGAEQLDHYIYGTPKRST